VKLHTRLQRLEQRLREPGCPACRDRRGRIVLVTSRSLPDGRTELQGDWPAPCERCSEAPEQIIEILEAMVETREDVARLAAEG
jgi:hypothetical protein